MAHEQHAESPSATMTIEMSRFADVEKDLFPADPSDAQTVDIDGLDPVTWTASQWAPRERREARAA
jgi:hypothetical protein